MANDNTLGAPTEGLGQTVTFTAGGSQTPQARGAQRSGLRTGQQGDGRANLTARPVGIQDAREGEAVLNVFRKLGNDILAPRLEAARNDAFLTGMQRAAGGEAITEIVNEQPWYSQMFGETPVVEGARAWTARARAQEEVLALETDMPTLRTKSPTEVKDLLNKRLASIQTGDRGTDALVVKSFMDEIPGLAKRHAKEHIAYQQAGYANAFRNSQFTAAARLAATRAAYDPDPAGKPKALLEGRDVGSVTDQGDLLEATGAFVSSFIKPVDLPQETYDTLTTGTIMGLLSQGNLHAYYALEDSPVIRNWLGVESQIKLQTAVDRAEAKAQNNLPLDLIDEIAKIKALPSQSDLRDVDPEINERVRRVTAAYTAITGSRRPPISGASLIEIKNSAIENHARGLRAAQAAWTKAQEAGAKAGDKEAAEYDAALKTSNVLLNGGSLRGLPSDQVRSAWQLLRDHPEGQDRLKRARRLASVVGTVDEVGADIIKQDAQLNFQTGNGAGWHKLYKEEWLPLTLPGNTSAAKAYFGDHYDNMAHYANSLAGQDPDKVKIEDSTGAFLRMKEPRAVSPMGTKEEWKSLREAVVSVADNIHPSGAIFGRHDLRDDQATKLALRLQGGIRELGSHIPVKDRARVALSDAKKRGLELGGGYVWEVPLGRTSFLDALNKYGTKPGTDELNPVIASTVQKFVTQLGIKEAGHSVHYYMNGEEPSLALLGQPDNTEADAQWITYIIPLEEFHKEFVRTGGKPAALRPTGPKLTYLPAEGAKSIYDR